MDKIVFQTGFPLSFFQIAHPTNFPMGSSLLFRAKSAMRVREHVLVHRYAETLFECAEKLLQRFRSVPVRLPHLENETPAMAASITRHALGLSPSAPIPDLIYATEKAGVFVLPLPIELDNVDAFSLRIGTNLASPLIVTMQQQFGDRFRFSVAHELGHLVMHQAIAGSVAKVEKEAHQFAGALLLPEDAMREELVPPVTLASLAALKPRWKVSMQSMIMRASDLQIVTARQKKYLFQQMSARGIRKREPAHLDIAIEKPRWLRQMAERL
ncbi:MAG: ImmA/IrrE family metallo-endopeptidase, partial [SAR202 cluster bacterium]|nr:ImmA/IrrE family metallo-endopeptidase [SAR202 cluster bacterium]